MVRASNPRIQYSQNLLHNRKLVANLVQQAGIDDRDVVLEIGPGRGIITRELAEHCAHVLAIEKDPASTQHLQQRFNGVGNVTIFAADFLDFPLPATAFKVFSNIPYNITAAIVGKLTTGVAPPLDTWLVLQREAAAKLIGQPRQTLTSLKLMPTFELSIEHTFRRTDFRPMPAVDSVLLRIHKRTSPLIDDSETDRYHDFVTAAFTAWKPNVRESLLSLVPMPVVSHLERTLGQSLLTKPGDTPAEIWLAIFNHLSALQDQTIWRNIKGASLRLTGQQGALKKDHRSRTSGRR